MNMIPYGRQDINQADIDSVIEILRSDFLTQGPAVPAFEDAVSKYCGALYAVAVNSATSALHIACLALDVGKNDLVWTTPITFVASANCALYCGADIDFVDIDPITYNISIDSLKVKLSIAEKKGKLPKVLVTVHFSGLPCENISIFELSQQYGFKVIEDASHAIGGKYRNEYIGNCRYSDITVFSFHPVKVITTTEGGMALTNSDVLANKLRLLRSHGITRDPLQMDRPPDGLWYYQQIELGYNYRMTDLQAALGISQLKRINKYIEIRHELANRYNKFLDKLPIKLPWQDLGSYSGLHLYVIRLQLQKIRRSHKDVFDSLRNQGIGVNLHYIPVYRQPYFERMGFNVQNFPEAERYYSEAISLPMYPAMSHEQQDCVIYALSKALEE